MKSHSIKSFHWLNWTQIYCYSNLCNLNEVLNFNFIAESFLCLYSCAGFRSWRICPLIQSRFIQSMLGSSNIAGNSSALVTSPSVCCPIDRGNSPLVSLGEGTVHACVFCPTPTQPFHKSLFGISTSWNSLFEVAPCHVLLSSHTMM